MTEQEARSPCPMGVNECEDCPRLLDDCDGNQIVHNNMYDSDGLVNWLIDGFINSTLNIISENISTGEATAEYRQMAATNFGDYNKQTYAESNVTPDRTFDADTVAVAELADIVGTLITDLRAQGFIF